MASPILFSHQIPSPGLPSTLSWNLFLASATEDGVSPYILGSLLSSAVLSRDTFLKPALALDSCCKPTTGSAWAAWLLVGDLGVVGVLGGCGGSLGGCWSSERRWGRGAGGTVVCKQPTWFWWNSVNLSYCSYGCMSLLEEKSSCAFMSVVCTW